jgi:Na+-driven multidrug efflux pump
MTKKELSLSFPLLGLVAATRAAVGAGVGLLVANALSRKQRKSIGIPLLIGGLLSTIPIALTIFGHDKQEDDVENDIRESI